MEKNKNINTQEERPLITFALFAYNQDNYIKEAVEGAFSQTYSPLEIILSDDCSADRTFEIMKEMTAAYCGPHQIILNRNEKNLGIGDHVNRIMELAGGELIVAAAGDDVSLPNRVAELYLAWEDSNRKALSLFSAYIKIDEAGNKIGIVDRGDALADYDYSILLKTPDSIVPGCAHAWDRRVFEVYGSLMAGSVIEDIPISFRSAYLGTIRYIPQPLVLYRLSPGSICRSRFRDVPKRNRDFMRAYQNILMDLSSIEDMSSTLSHHDRFIKCAKHRYAYYTGLCLLHDNKLRGIRAILLPIDALLGGFSVRSTMSLAFRVITPRLDKFIRRIILKRPLNE